MQIIDTQQLSRATGKAQRTIQLWQQQGKLPQPLPVKNRTIWTLDTIRDWLIVHMPAADLSALEGV
ncbi:MAG: helix-turn-helix transcriptional regulator [Flavobacteriales bacterium]